MADLKNNKISGKIAGLKIGIASPEQIRKWSYGEITRSETINYKSLKPEKDGLFNELVFGPVKDYECSCGKYKKVKYRGKKCESCGVEITESIVRRERMGHIELAAPVAHIWMTKELPRPSKISLLLDIPYKQVEQVLYFVNWIVLDEGDYAGTEKPIFKKKEIIDSVSEKNSRASRSKIRKALGDIYNDLKLTEDKNSLEIKKARIYRERLRDSNLPFSIDEVFRFITKYKKIKFGIGAEAINQLLMEIDLQAEDQKINEELSNLKETNTTASFSQNEKKLLRRLEVVKWLKESGNKPEWMILKVLPVTPPDTRPIIQLDGGRFTTSDINNLYRKIIIRNQRLKRIIELNAPTIILNNEKRMLQEAVDALFDNSSKKKPIVGKDKRVLKSLSNYLKGKQGLFRQNLLGKRVDYSGRSVIVVGPELKMYEVGIPATMILKLFKPFIIHELIRKFDDYGLEIIPIAANIRIAEEMIGSQDDQIWPIVHKVIKQRPVILNRAPTLHRLGIQAFEPKMIEGKAIRLHPLVTTAFNADFDGDQMAVHVPLSEEAVSEARSILLASWHILGPKDGKPIITPTQDMVLGNYYLSMEDLTKGTQGLIFKDINEVKLALAETKIHTHTVVGISTKAFPEKKFETDGVLITSVGKLILNEVLPDSFPYINDTNIHKPLKIVPMGQDVRKVLENHVVAKPFSKKVLSSIIDILYKEYPIKIVPETMDKIKYLGFHYSMISATTISAFDVPLYDKKYEYFKTAEEQVMRLKQQYKKGLLTNDERYQKVIRLWTDVKDKVTDDIKNIVESPEYEKNSIVIMADSGARGNISNFTQLAGMRGLMSKSYNYDQKSKSKIIRDIIEIPIKHSFIEGLSISEFFNSSYGARKGMTDTAMKTSKSGYMTRKLVDATQEVVINNEDCKTSKGLVLRALINRKENSVIEPLSERVLNRFAFEDIKSPKDGSIIVAAHELVTHEKALLIDQHNVEEIIIRSPIHCANKNGVCQKCFGIDLSTNKLVEEGTAIGIIAAQSIGEPGTQLTMRTFHTGGVAGGSNITQGFERLKQLFDVVSPKPWEKALISEIDGEVIEVPTIQNDYQIIIGNDVEKRTYKTSYESNVIVKKGQAIVAGQKIVDGLIDIQELLDVAGIEKVRHYFIKEVQKVYRIQGIDISDKYIEIIIKQLTNKIRITSQGDSKFFVGEVVSLYDLKEETKRLIKQGKNPAHGVNQVFGLGEAPSKSNSFLSAASFQDTKKILTNAATKGQIDYLYGVKENVILGNLIPAGTGLKTTKEINEVGDQFYKLEY
ncbi:MAG: DNA-directed RNA polymerase subunit beta' [Mycoplasma sp.]